MSNDNPKFKVGQIVCATSTRKELPFRIQEVIEDDGAFYYKWNGRNALHEKSIRALTLAEKGESI